MEGLLGWDVDIIVTYTDVSGEIRTAKVKSKDLSPSWVWEDPKDNKNDNLKDDREQLEQSVELNASQDSSQTEEYNDGAAKYSRQARITPSRIQRRQLRQIRREQRTNKLIHGDLEAENHMLEAAMEHSKQFNNTVNGKYGIWRKEFVNPNSDSTLKLMLDQIIMARVYQSIAQSRNDNSLIDSLKKYIKESRDSIGEANSDVELQPRALEQAKKMGHALSAAKDKLYECSVVARKLRAMLQSTEESVNILKKQSSFLIQLAAKTIPKPLHCLTQQLTADYLLEDYASEEDQDDDKTEDPTHYHYSIFSDNVLATSVVVNSTANYAKEPEKHVFHIVSDKLNVAAMKMWFRVNAPPNVTIEIKNIDDFKWLNSSYCPVLRQLESARMKEYYFKANHPSTISAGDENLKYRNPKYLSMLNHLRFYLPEVYPKLDKILFLDDDIVVQRDLTPLWSVDLQGMVNGAVETCKESFHRFDKYLNFSNPLISENFDPNACGWAFGMNMFDLKEWKKQNITGIYHMWQDKNEERTLWKLGSLPPGLTTFYKLTYPLERSWHVLGLGYDSALNQTEIDNAAVVHYNGNYKPWLELAIPKYRGYWSKFLKLDNPYLRRCSIDFS
ncbi:putative galacturonosyltransferase 3 [Asimina triloba]